MMGENYLMRLSEYLNNNEIIDEGENGDKALDTILDLANLAADEWDADVLLINSPIAPGLEASIRDATATRTRKRDHVIVILISAGGIADDAYRAAVALRSNYTNVTMCIAGWCKSAGTLMAIGADDLVFGCNGEMGPLDVQIAVKDELVENRDSGLILDAAIQGLTDNAFRVFEKFMTSLIERSQGAITFRTAADLAADVTIGLMSPVYEKIDPLRMGADQRAQKIGRDYAIRLNLKAENLRGAEALNMLLNGYPSHGFVIDLDEAERLFNNVKPLAGYLESVVEALGPTARFPGETKFVGYLNGVRDGETTEDTPESEEHDASSSVDKSGNIQPTPKKPRRAVQRDVGQEGPDGE